MLIAVPSKGRAGLTSTNKILPNICTFSSLKVSTINTKGLVKNIVCVPKEVRGITPTRNWIFKNTDEQYVVMLDDDAKHVGYNFLDERKTKKIEIRDEGFWAEEF